jgi:hypothetical protein
MKKIKAFYNRFQSMRNARKDALLALLLIVAIILTLVFEYI